MRPVGYDGSARARLELARQLLSVPGAELTDRAAEAGSGRHALAAGAALRRTHPPELVAAAFAQAELRAAAAVKFGASAATMWFTREGLEQASSAAAATHRAERLCGPGDRVADLCCGIGGDLRALGATGAAVVGVDREPLRARLALANCPTAALAVTDARALRLGGLDAVFVDPARRQDGRRTGRDGEPPLSWCLELPVPRLAVKAAPGIDPVLVPSTWQTEFVAVDRDLKEAVLWSPEFRSGGPARIATVLGSGRATTLADDGGGAAPLADPSTWLLDPNPAVGRAGAVDALARRLGAAKLDARIAFLTSSTRMVTPFGRLLRVEHHQPFDLKSLRVWLRSRDVGAADLRRRGLAGDVDQLRAQLRLSGDRRVTLVMTRLRNAPWAVVCVEPDDPALEVSSRSRT